MGEFEASVAAASKGSLGILAIVGAQAPGAVQALIDI